MGRGNPEQDKAVVTVKQMTKLAYDDIILSIDCKMKEDNVAMKHVKIAKYKLHIAPL